MIGIGFEIHLAGLVNADTLKDFGDLDVTTAAASTVLIGEAVDQAALMGLLARLRKHGLVITEVRRRLDDVPPAPESSA